MTARLRWLDLLRSAAVFGMIAYHAAYDLQAFHGWDIDVTAGAWKAFQIAVASLFLVVSGLSAGFWTRSEPWFKAWERFCTLLGAAFVVSVATYVADPETWVRFGILHCIAVGSLALPAARKLHPTLVGLFGVVILAFGPLIPAPPFATVDWVPPVPWIGPMLLGFAVGIPLAARAWKPAAPSKPLDLLAWPGRHSLGIYLLHQPVLIALLWLALPR